MRVTNRVRRDERGTVLIVVAVFVIVAVVFLAFVVDIGNQRQDRRQFTTATDASALDVAQEWSRYKLSSTTFPGGDCSAMAQNYLVENRADDAPDSYSCVATRVNGRLGSVTVSADDTVDYQVANAIGIDEGGTASSTTVRIRSTTGGGLRPFAVCASESPELKLWIDSWTLGTPLPPTDLIIGGPKFLPSNCGENNGNWGMVAFQSQDSGVGNIDGNGLAGTLARGSLDDTITVGESASGDAVTECNKSYETQAAESGISCVFQVTGNPWTNDGVEDAFDYLKDEGIVFNLPVYGDRVDLGGSGTGFPIVAFLEVELLSYCGDTSPTLKAEAQLALGACSGGKDNFVHVQLNKVTAGKCCDVNKDNRIFEICDVGDLGGGVVPADLLQNCQTPDGASTPPPPVPDADCTLVGVTPSNRDVPVTDTGASIGPATFDYEVLDASRCGTMTVSAIGPTTASGTVSGPVDDVYTATFPTGTTFTSSAATFGVRLAEDGLAFDTSASIDTVPLAPCAATAPTFDPVPERAQTTNNGGKVSYTNDLVADLQVRTDLSNPDNCSTLTIKVFHPGANKVLTATPSPLGPTVSATFGRSSPDNGWNWTTGTYTVQVQRNGVILPGAQSTFTLP